MPLRGKLLYTYADLPSSDSIRLIELQPGHEQDRIKFRFIVTDINTSPAYEAISYVWGDSTDHKIIDCDGGLLKVKPSLHEVLQRFRYTDVPRLLWVDATCINQENSIERSYQVGLMGKIYRQAQRVLIWLGKDENGDAEAIFKHVIRLTEIWNKKVEGYSFITEIHYGEEDLDPEGKMAESISAIGNLPWFKRVWVIQEVGVSSQATMYLGDAEMEWSTAMRYLSHLFRQTRYIQPEKLSTIIEHVNGTKSYTPPISSVLYPWLSFDTTRDTLDILALSGLLRNPSFLDVLDFARDRKAQDARDHIYAFLSHPCLQQGTINPIIQPRYDRSVVEVYVDFAVNWIKTFGRAHLLSYVHHFEKRSEIKDSSTMHNGFPTWVPQWNVRNPTELLNPASHSHGFNTSRSNAFKFDVWSNRLLVVTGFVFSQVEWCSEKMSREGDADSLGFLMLSIWKRLLDQKLCRPVKYSNEIEAFSLTLTAGQLQGCPGRLTPEHLEKHFESFSIYWHQLLQSESVSEVRQFNGHHGNAKRGPQRLFERTAYNICQSRRFFMTKNGYFGLGPRVLQKGDVCCTIFGAEVPYILRSCEDGKFRFVEECYIQGIMYGESMDMLQRGECQKQSFEVR